MLCDVGFFTGKGYIFLHPGRML